MDQLEQDISLVHANINNLQKPQVQTNLDITDLKRSTSATHGPPHPRTQHVAASASSSPLSLSDLDDGDTR